MADRTQARAFGAAFRALAAEYLKCSDNSLLDPCGVRAKNALVRVAEVIYDGMDGDFTKDQMEADDACEALGLLIIRENGFDTWRGEY